MSIHENHEILLIAGDYDIVQCVRRALSAPYFSVNIAFNHSEAIYVLEHSRFDALLIDSAMIDRHTGTHTLKAFAEADLGARLVAFALENGSAAEALSLADEVVTQLDQRDTLVAVTQALNLPMPETKRLVTESSAEETDTLLRRQLDEISTLISLSKSLTEVLDVSEVLNRLVEAARHLTDAEEAMLLLPEGEELYLRAKVGIEVESARNFRIKTQDTLAGQVFQSGKPTLLGASGPQKVKTEYFVNSLLYVPMLLKDEVIGILGVNNKNKDDPFDMHHQELLVNLASFASIAIHNARVHEESVERRRELETLVTASQVVNSSVSMDEALPNICKQLASVLNVGYSEIFKWDEENSRLITLARHYEAAWRYGRGPATDLARATATRTTLERDQHIWIQVDERPNTEEAAYMRRTGAVAMFLLPIVSSGQILGAVRAFYTIKLENPDTIVSKDTINRLRKMALDTLVNLLNRTDRIMSDSLLELSEEVNNSVHSDWCDLSLMERSKNTLIALSRIGKGVWLESPSPYINLTRYEDLDEVLKEKSLINHRIINRSGQPGIRILMDKTESRALLGIPLVQRGKAQGLVIFADTERDRQFSDREISLAKAIVGQAATALENANLVRDLELSFHELKNAQDRLVQAARLSAMGELAAVVAHQINNPLTTIIVDTELMLLDEPQDSPNYGSLMAIARAGKRAANVARRLLAIARPADASTESDLIDVVDTLRGVLSLVQTHIERGSVRITTDLPESSIPRVAAVKGRLDDIWLNLMMNAYDAINSSGQADGRIDVKVRFIPEKGSISVEILDNGPGIPDEIKHEIFSPFFTTKPVGEGTGLGLHVCREVVENVGGQITVESKVGEFTRFIVQVPVAE